MKMIRGAKLALLAAVAILATTAVSSAEATPNLVLKTGTELVPNNSPVEIGYVLDECGMEFYGTVGVNQKPSIGLVLTKTAPGELMCEPPLAIAGVGGSKDASLNSSGALVFQIGSVKFTKSASCAYTFKGTTSFAIPGAIIGEGMVTGGRTEGSSPSCPLTDTERLVTTVTGPHGVFEASLG